MKDWRGTEIEIGSIVVYTIYQGQGLVVQEGKVIALPADKGRIIEVSYLRSSGFQEPADAVRWAPLGMSTVIG